MIGQSLRLILSLRMNLSFITSRPGPKLSNSRSSDYVEWDYKDAAQTSLHLRPSSVFIISFQESLTATWGDGTYYIISFCVHNSFGTWFEW